MVYHGLRTCLWVALNLLQAPSAVGTDNVNATTYSPASTIPISTCEARSVNYVAHGLPQQCLNTIPRYASTETANSSASSTAATAAGDVITIVETHTPASVVVVSTPTIGTGQTDGVEGAPASGDSATTHSNPSPSAATPAEGTASETDADSLLDNAKFLSFEEWKKQNLEQAGQSAENLQPVHGPDTQGRERKRPGINNALDSLGDDAEIELDFIGFGGGHSGESKSHATGASSHSAAPQATAAGDAPTPARKRSKDAGKTCKERFNYASFDCAANVLKTNPQCKSASSVLVENKDSYMLNECSADNKFVIVELCNDILIDTVVLANFEFFSSMFRTFRVSVSDKYPVKIDKWKELGTFEARNSREIQAFLVENPLIWARYLRVEFLTHYGNEYYCPLSLLRVHGTTMMEEYREEQKKAQGIDPDEDDVEEEEEEAEGVVRASNTASVPPPEASEDVESQSIPPEPAELPPAKPTSVCLVMDPASSVLAGAPTEDTMCRATESPPPPLEASVPVTTTASENIAQNTITESTITSVKQSQQTEEPVTASEDVPSNTTVTAIVASSQNADAESNATTHTPSAVVKVITASTVPQGAVATSVSSVPSSPPPIQQPPTQESFFKSINKRLSFLEANSTLSLQYIESQSQLLRDAFSKVEKRNLAKTSEFLNTLNTTVLAELARYKAEYEQLWQSTVLELSSQRDEGRREREVMGERIRVLAEEMVAQKRLMAVQATLLLLCLVLVVFGKFSAAEVSWVQSMQGLVRRSRPSSRRRKDETPRTYAWESPWDSPTQSKGSPRQRGSREEEREMPRFDRAITSPNPLRPDGTTESEPRSRTSHQGVYDDGVSDAGNASDDEKIEANGG